MNIVTVRLMLCMYWNTCNKKSSLSAVVMPDHGRHSNNA